MAATPRSRRWRVSDLDAELRYVPVLRALPPGEPICEIGCGARGIAGWTPRRVLGVEPDADPAAELLPNLERVAATAGSLPFADAVMRATVAVDTFEHIDPARRAAAVAEMVRVTAPGGRVVINGPAGAAAARGDRAVLERLRRRGAGGGGSARWLSEHVERGLPAREDFERWLELPRVRRVRVRRVFNVRLWYVMHLAAMGALPRTGPLHGVVWGPFAAIARRWHRGPCYRLLVVADVG